MESTLEAALKDWKEREQRYEKLFSPAVLKSREFLREKLRHFDGLRANVIANPSDGHRLAIKALELERKQLARQVYPNIFIRLLERVISSFRIGSDVAKVQQKSQDNSEGIRAALIKSGLGAYSNQVQEQMKQGNREFSLPVSYHVNEHEKMDLLLHFKKNDQGSYHFESYKATLHSELEKGKPKQHTFSTDQDGLLNTGKAYNLLAGRAVQQPDGLSWQQLDFNDKDASGNFRIKHFNENYGYSLEAAIAKLPLKQGGQDDLLNRLRQGELVAATLLISGKEHSVSIDANPHKKEIAIYDAGGQKTTPEQLKDKTRQGKADNVKQLQPKQDQGQIKVKSKAIKI